MSLRSKQMWMVAFFLSRYAKTIGVKSSKPPDELQTLKWKDAYCMFYEALGDGRTINSFENSLQNTRDSFDSHLDSNRVGWFASDGTPVKLNLVAKLVFDDFSKISRCEIWNQISVFADLNVPAYRIEINDLSAIQDMEADERNSKTEGGLRMFISVRSERNISLRNMAFKIHGYDCAVCRFNFGKVYGDWGSKFAEVHHIIPFADSKGINRIVNPRTDLIVLCPNCHRMLHRKKGITLTVEELKIKLIK